MTSTLPRPGRKDVLKALGRALVNVDPGNVRVLKHHVEIDRALDAEEISRLTASFHDAGWRARMVSAHRETKIYLDPRDLERERQEAEHRATHAARDAECLARYTTPFGLIPWQPYLLASDAMLYLGDIRACGGIVIYAEPGTLNVAHVLAAQESFLPYDDTGVALLLADKAGLPDRYVTVSGLERLSILPGEAPEFRIEWSAHRFGSRYFRCVATIYLDNRSEFVVRYEITEREPIAVLDCGPNRYTDLDTLQRSIRALSLAHDLATRLTAKFVR